MASYEIEIKSLLGPVAQADALKERMRAADPSMILVGKGAQLNHYFVGGDTGKLKEIQVPFVDKEKQNEFREILEQGKEFSIRTREVDGVVMLVIKASLDDMTSANGISRREFEAPVTLTLDALDGMMWDTGFSYQAKWSREREEYQFRDIHITVDKNAGYGYVAEFEALVHDDKDAQERIAYLHEIMHELNVEELDQERLARMFDYYNTHWQEYYGTEKVFVVH